MDWLHITLIGFGAGAVGTGLGGVLALFLRRPSARTIGMMLGLAAGIMLVIVFLELVPEGLATGFVFPVLGLVLGIGALLLMDEHFAHHHFVSSEVHHPTHAKKGVLIATGVALHNFPEGLAIGAGFAASASLGITLAILITLHNTPEGLAAAIPLRSGGLRPGRIVLTTVVAGLPMGVGAMVGGLLGAISPFMLGASLGFAAGAMLYIVSDELIPDVYRLASPHVAIGGITAGVLLGLVMLQFV
jgi:ZIP family zinc transporter